MVLAKVKGTDAQLISNNDYRKIYLLKNPGRKGSIQTFASVPLSSTSGLSLLNITVDNNVVLNGTLPTGISTMADLIGKKIMFLTGKSKGEIKVIIDAEEISGGSKVAVLDSPFTNADHKVSASDKYMILVDADSEREMLKVTLTTDAAVSNDIQVQGGTSSAKGYVTFSDTESIGGSPRRHLYLTETFKEFQANETLTNVATSTSVGTVYSTTPQKLGFEYYYNELLYAEARQPITRAADQTENIRIVLQF